MKGGVDIDHETDCMFCSKKQYKEGVPHFYLFLTSTHLECDKCHKIFHIGCLDVYKFFSKKKRTKLVCPNCRKDFAVSDKITPQNGFDDKVTDQCLTYEGDINRNTLLMLFVIYCDNENTILELFDKYSIERLKTSNVNNNGDTALMLAIKYNRKRVIMKLLEYSDKIINLYAKNKKKMNALLLSVIFKDENTALKLTEYPELYQQIDKKEKVTFLLQAMKNGMERFSVKVLFLYPEVIVDIKFTKIILSNNEVVSAMSFLETRISKKLFRLLHTKLEEGLKEDKTKKKLRRTKSFGGSYQKTKRFRHKV
jgi:ankyrin repeat protein